MSDDHKFTFGKRGPRDLRDFKKPQKKPWRDDVDAMLGFAAAILVLAVAFAVGFFASSHG